MTSRGDEVGTPPDDVALRRRRGGHERIGFRVLRRRLLWGLSTRRGAKPEQPERDQHYGPPESCAHAS